MTTIRLSEIIKFKVPFGWYAGEEDRDGWSDNAAIAIEDGGVVVEFYRDRGRCGKNWPQDPVVIPISGITDCFKYIINGVFVYMDFVAPF